MKIAQKIQKRWDQIGALEIVNIEKNPENYIINSSPYSQRQFNNVLTELLHPFKGKKILEYGCGTGNFSIFLSKQGTEITAIDINPSLLTASQKLAEINNVNGKFLQANVTELPFKTNIYDVVIGIAVLHHLTEPDLQRSIQEAYRVLKKGGLAIFSEPVENSRVFDFIQNIIPVGIKGSDGYRPSILSQKDWKTFLTKTEDRVLTNKEFILASKQFESIHIHPFGFLVRLKRIVRGRFSNRLASIDDTLFKIIPPLRYLSQTVLVVYRK
jgi:ubiquinone/menaquinone biosynthesis C-methylase UbiE